MGWIGDGTSAGERLADRKRNGSVLDSITHELSLFKKNIAAGDRTKLDDYVEMYLEGTTKLKVDFEIGDALEKVERLGVVYKEGNMWKAVPLAQALETRTQQELFSSFLPSRSQ